MNAMAVYFQFHCTDNILRKRDPDRCVANGRLK